MSKKRISIASRFSILVVAIIIMLIALSQISVGYLFRKSSYRTFYENANTALSEFSNSITLFFNSKECELNVFTESEAIKNADETIHSFVNETGTIKILDYEKSPVEEDIRTVCKSFANNDSDIAEIYIGTKWGGYATNFDNTMNGGYDPRKRGWYETANKGKGKVMITDAFASTVGDTVVGITRCAYDDEGTFIGNTSIEVSLDTLTSVLKELNLGEGSFFMMLQKDGTILADTGPGKNNFKNITELGIPDFERIYKSNTADDSVYVENGTYTNYLTKKITNPKTGYQIIAFSPNETVFKEFHKTLSTAMLVCFIFGALAAIFMTFFANKTLRPLKVIRNSISENTKEISEGKGDLRKRISVASKNEIGDVADSFNIFSEKLQEIIKSMKSSKTYLNDAGEKLNHGTSEAMNAIENINSSIQTMDSNLKSQDASVEQTSSMLSKILENIKKLELLVETQGTAVSGASATVEQMIRNIGDVNTSIDKMASSFGILSTDAESGAKTQSDLQTKIGEIETQSKLLSEANSVIANIANQTNLLAMNAAIEAAHAGEAGKGFAVVADEIRKLSETSSSQSKTIGEQLNNIQNTIALVVEATQRGVQGYSHLANEINETDTLVQQIKLAMTEQQTGSSQIIQALKKMNDSTKLVQSASLEMIEGSQSIATEVTTLQKETSVMKDSMADMNTSSIKINETGVALKEISELLESSIAEVGKQVDQFQV